MWCGECSDYPTCENIYAQASKNSCCASAVAERQCSNGRETANDCVRTCFEAAPPCIIEMAVKVPEVERRAKDDRNNAVEDGRAKVQAATGPLSRFVRVIFDMVRVSLEFCGPFV
eukprot:gnl/TRDRNA2_/TRDRNA2_173754_c1_seq8.p4 gnl/TRDRNA2_/TRDRNA2_173754_c1~~gnl/TRDRNA2_/TRDRNA2_173754_c1_seq8.p4  ORF type:complete len:134 (-),score=19.22 gnl/TRDRNA2_/TRDRNA2_173754_c1_seq8:944-1288(-)